MKRFILIFLFLTSVVSCGTKRTVDIKSPCVSNEDGPCGSRKPINDWWLKNKTNNS